jgi:hypothetical protein
VKDGEKKRKRRGRDRKKRGIKGSYQKSEIKEMKWLI